MFNPFNLIKGCCYSVEANIKGPPSSYEGGGAEEVISHSVTFFFRNCWNGSTTTVCGQFADFLFKLS